MRWLRRQASALACLALRGSVAQSCSGTTTATSLPSACSTWTGDLVVPTGAQDEVRLDGLEKIDGSLSIRDAFQITRLSSDSLTTISETLDIFSTTILSEIDFPQLTVIGDLEMSGLPSMQENSLLRTLQNLSSLSIINTGIGELEGFNLETMEFIQISYNPYLQSINFQPWNITGSIEIQANGQNLDVSMPNLQTAQNMTFRNCNSIRTPSLEQSFSLVVDHNDIEEFNGAPLLREVDGGLSFVNNQQLTRIALPELTTVAGGLYVSNNSKLEALDELYSLESIRGAVDLSGPLENVTFQGMTDVQGKFVINSTRDVPCARFDQYYTDGPVQGDYECTTGSDASDSSSLSRASTADDSASPVNPGATSQADEDDNGGLGVGARVGVGVGVGGGVGAICGLIVGLIFHRRAKRRKASASLGGEVMEKDGDEVDHGFMLGNDSEKHELEQPLAEAGTGKEAAELPAKHGAAELVRSASTKAPPGVEGRHEMPANEVTVHEMDAWKGEKEYY